MGFTDIDSVAQQIRAAWFIFNIFVIFDTTQGIASTVLKASGKQKYGAILTFFAYFVLGIPVSIYLVFYNDKGIFGIWVGPSIACAFNTFCYLIIYKCINWNNLIKEIAEKMEKNKF